MSALRPTLIVRKPVGFNCYFRAVDVARGDAPCKGVMARIDASRLEEGLGHELFQCTDCRRRVKYVPSSSSALVGR